MKYRSDYRINVVFCGFTETEINCINLYDAKEYYIDDEYSKYKKNPHLIYVDKLEDAYMHRGFALFLKVDKDFDPLEFDKKYRRKLNYWYIYCYNENFKEGKRHSKYNNIYWMHDAWLYCDWYDAFIDEIDDYLKEHPKRKIQEVRKNKIKEMHKALKPIHEISSKEISDKFNISIRSVERYMNDMNYLYHDVGYDYTKNIWYIVK